MSYPMDLDETPLEKIVEELRRRGEISAQGNCDYCGRHPYDAPCKLPERHNTSDAADAKKALHDIGDRKGWDASKRMNEPCDFINTLGLGDAFRDWLNTRPR